MTLFIVGLVCVVLACAAIIYRVWLEQKHHKKTSRNVEEIMKALAEADQYSDGEGWIAIRKINRDNYFDIGKKR